MVFPHGRAGLEQVDLEAEACPKQQSALVAPQSSGHQSLLLELWCGCRRMQRWRASRADCG